MTGNSHEARIRQRLRKEKQAKKRAKRLARRQKSEFIEQVDRWTNATK